MREHDWHLVRKQDCQRVRDLDCHRVRDLDCHRVRDLDCHRVRDLDCHRVRDLDCHRVRDLDCHGVRKRDCHYPQTPYRNPKPRSYLNLSFSQPFDILQESFLVSHGDILRQGGEKEKEKARLQNYSPGGKMFTFMLAILLRVNLIFRRDW